MEPKPVRPAAVAIQQRFFEALNRCIKEGRISSLQSFCQDNDLNRPKYVKLRQLILNPEIERTGKPYKVIDIDALSYIVKDGKVSASWLLTGKGDIFK